MFLLHELDQLLYFEQVCLGHLVAVEEHALCDLSLDAVINIEELLDVISVDNVLWLLWVCGVQPHLAVLFKRDSGDATYSLLHYF